jgi:hypothetical protein
VKDLKEFNERVRNELLATPPNDEPKYVYYYCCCYVCWMILMFDSQVWGETMQERAAELKSVNDRLLRLLVR